MAASPVVAHPHRVRDLNDAFRRSFSGGRVVISAGVAALPSVARAALLTAVRGFDPRPHAVIDDAPALLVRATPYLVI